MLIQYASEWSRTYPIEVLCDDCNRIYFAESLYSFAEEPKNVYSNLKCFYCGSMAKTARLHLDSAGLKKRSEPRPPNDPRIKKTWEWKINKEGVLIREVCFTR